MKINVTEDTHNADNKVTPDKTWMFAGLRHVSWKLSKVRTTLVIAANMSRTEKITLSLRCKSAKLRY